MAMTTNIREKNPMSFANSDFNIFEWFLGIPIFSINALANAAFRKHFRRP